MVMTLCEAERKEREREFSVKERREGQSSHLQTEHAVCDEATLLVSGKGVAK